MSIEDDGSMNMRSFPIKMATVCLVAVSLFMYGCGGGGGSSSVDDATPETDAMPGGEMPDPESTGPTQAEIDEEAMKLGAAIGLDKDGEAIDVPARLPSGVTPSNGKIATGMNAGDFMAHDGDVAGITGWDSDATMRTDAGTRTTTVDTIVLYSNIDDPTDAAYSTYFGADGGGTDLDGDGTADLSLIGADNASNPSGIDFTDDGFSVSKQNAGHLVFSGLDATPGRVLTIKDIPATDNADEREVVGTFFGIGGEYTCASEECRVRVTDEGGLAIVGSLTFNPDRRIVVDVEGTEDDPTLVEGVIPDADYLVFGYWLEATTRNGQETYQLSPYSTGSLGYGDTGNAVTGTVQGMAEYEGPATGRYLKKTLTTEGGAVTGGPPFSTGQFTATANLKAYFGGTGVAARDANTISGTVSGFMDGDTSINDGWTLKLNKSLISTSAAWDLADTGNADTQTLTSQGTTSGNDRHGGAWSATFHGSTMVPTSGDDTTNSMQPGSIAGTFNGHFQDGHVAGAFGATKE